MTVEQRKKFIKTKLVERRRALDQAMRAIDQTMIELSADLRKASTYEAAMAVLDRVEATLAKASNEE